MQCLSLAHRQIFPHQLLASCLSRFKRSLYRNTMSAEIASASGASAPPPFAYYRDESDEALAACATGAVTKDQFADVLRSGHKYSSYVCLLPSFTDETCPKDAIEKAGLKFVHLPVEVPVHLNVEKAHEIHKVLSTLATPVWVQCASANRASAALLIHLAMKHKWTPAQAMHYGKTHDYKCMSSEMMRNWVIHALSPMSGATISGAQAEDVFFRQLFDPVSSTYTYIVACATTKEGVIIDPVLEKVDRDVNLCNELGVRLKYSLNTHVHADHVSGSKSLKAKVAALQSCIAEVSGATSDVYLKEGDTVKFGSRHLKVLSTAGHTAGCLSYVLDDDSMVFTGDALFVRGCGRTDFQQGNPELLYDNIHSKVFTLPESCVVYPGHDYNGHLRSTVGEELRFNPRLNKTKEEFVRIMNGLGLPRPKLIDVAVPANMLDGVPPPKDA